MSEKLRNKLIIDFWAKRLKEATAYPLSTAPAQNSAKIELQQEEVAYFYQLSKKQFLPEFTLLTAIYTALLKRYFPGEANWLVANLSDTTMASQQLAVAIDPQQSCSLKDWIHSCKEEVSKVYQHRQYQVEDLALRLSGNTLVNYSNFALSLANTSGQFISLGVAFQLHILLKEDDCIELQMHYNNDFVNAYVVEQFLVAYKNCLIHLKVNLSQPIDQIALLSPAEYQKVTFDFNDNAFPYPVDASIVTLFEKRVHRTPDALAVLCGEVAYTYAEFNEKINAFAHYLLTHYALQADDIVGILMPKSVDTLISIFGILKAGAAYLPIDVNYPKARIHYIVQDSALKLLVCKETFSDLACPCPTLIFSELKVGNSENPNIAIQPSDLAYVIYTSGSTGQPKGVMIEHRSNINMSFEQIRLMKIGEQDRVACFASIAFDASVSEIMQTFYAGAVLVIPTEDEIRNPRTFAQ
ncbi:MAG: AMP-binding protein, partial [Bacteroidota bacterium]